MKITKQERETIKEALWTAWQWSKVSAAGWPVGSEAYLEMTREAAKYHKLYTQIGAKGGAK